MSATTWSYKPVDSLFFKEAREMESSGLGEVQSLFPPPVNTLIGATRSLIAETALGASLDWQQYAKNGVNHKAAILIGYGENLGPLSFNGPWLRLQEDRLYPVPLNLLHSIQSGDIERLLPDTRLTNCDLGPAVRLPVIPESTNNNLQGAKPLSDCWVKRSVFESLLTANRPMIPQKDLFSKQATLSRYASNAISQQDSDNNTLVSPDPRLGIGRDNRYATAKEGMLYQTSHIRTQGNLAFEVDVTGCPVTQLPGTTVTRFGGEGRAASVQLIDQNNSFPQAPDIEEGDGLILYMVTPALFTDDAPLINAAQRDNQQRPTITRGNICGIDVELHSAVVGKPLREGGWDIAKRKPRDVYSLVPAGSCYYIIPTGSAPDAANKLHGAHVGSQPEYGRGMIAVGRWKNPNSLLGE